MHPRTVFFIGLIALTAACSNQPPPSGGASAAQPAAPRSATPPTKPSPDRSTPLDRYTPLTDKEQLHIVVLAFATPRPSDDQLFVLVPDAARISDAFAQREALATHRADIDARLDAARRQRYYRFDAMATSPAAVRPGALRWDWTTVQLGAYDFASKAFPLRCFQTSSLADEATPTDSGLDAVHFAMDPNARCSLPVPDETLARTIESARSSAPLSTLKVRAALYFFVSDARVSFPNIVNATLTHVELSLIDPGRAGPTRLNSFPRLVRWNLCSGLRSHG